MMFPGFQQFPEGQIIAFALVFLRVIAFVIAWPVFGTQVVPTPVKVLLALVLSMVIFPVIGFKNADLIKINDQIIFMAVRELILGLLLGYLLRFFFFAISIGGELVGVSSGLASAQIFNPAMGTQSNVMEQGYLILATLFFLAMNGHHLFLQGLAQSYELVPIADTAIKYQGFASISTAFREAFLMGIKMASPIVLAVFIANLTMGVLGRAVPQLNVMVMSFQVTIVITVAVFFITVPLFVDEMNGIMQLMAEKFFSAMKVL
jgi:flagellar biosynthesis protein FliR